MQILRIRLRRSRIPGALLLTAGSGSAGSPSHRRTSFRKTAFFQVADTKHYANEFLALVGATAVARKGMAIDISEGILYTVDPEWAINKIAYGFNSGEGVVHKVRDPRTKIKVDKNGKEEEKIVDPGVDDKRCLCVSTEFGELLTVMNREGCTLTMVIRNAWDNRKKIEIKYPGKSN